MEFEILNTCPLFHGVYEGDLSAILGCLDARVRSFSKGELILREGDRAERMGVVLEGNVHILREDHAGNRTVIGAVGPGQLFGEVFACAQTERLPVSAQAAAHCRVLLVDCRKLLTTCAHSCSFHNTVIRNLLRIVAEKNLMLNRKLEFLAKRTTREKLLAFLSAHAKTQGGGIFSIPYDRQALADYLGVERSAMSAELSKLKKEGILDFHKNQFRFL